MNLDEKGFQLKTPDSWPILFTCRGCRGLRKKDFIVVLPKEVIVWRATRLYNLPLYKRMFIVNIG